MKSMLRFLVAGVALIALRAGADVAIVVAPQVPLETITIEQLERLYLHRPDRYPQGVKLTPLDQSAGSEIRKHFVRNVLWKSEIEVAEFWSRRMYSGKGRPPRQLRGDEAMLREVSERPGSIGYVDAAAVDERVKVLLVLP